mmetsp:Transcript_9571/g.23637  ORF Transcript_9571/g.23637 Transcript_9571/m.23637 type:complete len:221 (-) Transcript_9571:479-1141(-)
MVVRRGVEHPAHYGGMQAGGDVVFPPRDHAPVAACFIVYTTHHHCVHTHRHVVGAPHDSGTSRHGHVELAACDRAGGLEGLVLPPAAHRGVVLVRLVGIPTVDHGILTLSAIVLTAIDGGVAILVVPCHIKCTAIDGAPYALSEVSARAVSADAASGDASRARHGHQERGVRYGGAHRGLGTHLGVFIRSATRAFRLIHNELLCRAPPHGVRQRGLAFDV